MAEDAINFIEANKTHFDKTAAQYDEYPHALERARRTAMKIREAYNFKEDITTVLEFACGTGLVSRELAPYTKRIVGVDISQGMVDQFNTRVRNQGIPPEEMQAFRAELRGEAGELGDEKFDVLIVSIRLQHPQHLTDPLLKIVQCASAYHHFPDIDAVTRILVHFLKPGGVLLVIDLAKNTGEDAHVGHEHHQLIPDQFHHIVPHRGGLGEPDMRKAFESAGLDSFSFSDNLVAKDDVRLFLAKGRKPQI
ncbi:hypothetical protein C0993_006790 [Termitomyces sp. T159_Od127]|nr:hypothetical protein C0993_006790 [Termitomyces sp. T159_Od127]